MDKAKETSQQRMKAMLSDALRSPATLERRAVVKFYEGPQMKPDEAMLPMPPHNLARSPKILLQESKMWLDRCLVMLRFLKRRA